MQLAPPSSRWLLQDLLSVFVCILFVKTIRVPSLRVAALQYLVYGAEQERAIAAVSELVERDERAKLLRAIAALALRRATAAPVGDGWLSREGMHDRLAEAVAVLLQAEPPAEPNA